MTGLTQGTLPVDPPAAGFWPLADKVVTHILGDVSGGWVFALVALVAILTVAPFVVWYWRDRLQAWLRFLRGPEA